MTVDLASTVSPSASVRVGGTQAAAGSLKFRGGRFAGTLAGRPVRSHAGASAAGLAARPLPLERLLALRRTPRLR
jgi:hypothetical protein